VKCKRPLWGFLHFRGSERREALLTAGAEEKIRRIDLRRVFVFLRRRTAKDFLTAGASDTRIKACFCMSELATGGMLCLRPERDLPMRLRKEFFVQHDDYVTIKFAVELSMGKPIHLPKQYAEKLPHSTQLS
jgi:hypothetical protein